MCHRLYVRTITSHHCWFYFLVSQSLYVWSHVIFDFDFWFAYTNNCKSCFDFILIFWHAIIHICEWLQVVFCFGFYFLVCNRSYVQTIARHILFLFFGVKLFVCVDDCKSCHIVILLSGMPTLVCANNCKSYFDFIFCVNYHWLKGLRAWIDGHGLIHHTKTL